MLTENLVFEEALPYFELRGHAHFFEGASTEEWPAVPPTKIIQLDQRWYWAVHFKQCGKLIELMCGTWRAELLLEKMGGDEYDLPQTYSILEFPFEHINGWVYKSKQVEPRIVPKGVYRAVISLTFQGPTKRPGPIAAFADLGLLQFYED